MNLPSLCAQCGTPTTGQGHCPNCGAPLGSQAGDASPAPGATPQLSATQAPPRVSQLAPSVVRKRSRRGPSLSAMLIWLMVAGTAVVIAVLLLVAQSGPKATEVEAAEPPTKPQASAEQPPQVWVISDALVDAKTRARAWHEDATLVNVSVTGARAGLVNLRQGGAISHVFGAPSRVALPGNPVGATVYVVRMTAEGTSAAEAQRPGSLIAAEPTCTGQEAWSKAVAAGLSGERPTDLEYRHEVREGRGLWFVSQQGESDAGPSTRRADGQTCAILLR